MSRSSGWRRTISDTVSWRQDQALNATIYILRETGPTGFLLKEEGEERKFKVFLGDPHHCNCPTFTKDKDLCKHICWLLLKKFRVPRQNPVTWQAGLVEREINEILRGIAARQEVRPSAAAKSQASAAGRTSSANEEGENGKGRIQQRAISEDDVCPICQEELLAKHQPVTYCRFGCGNSVHIKCMKVWAEHQRTQGETIVKCPFCREDFGPLSSLQQEYRNSSIRETRAHRLNEHLGTTCKKCHNSPVVGKCYKCAVCADYHLCQACFNTPTHNEHSFQFREKTNQRWRPASNRGSAGVLPEAVVQQLMNRELSEHDYDLLLQLDSQSSQQSSEITEATIKSFRLERVRMNSALLAPGQQCRVCLRGYEEGQFVRQLPCRHKFHRDCIDGWLLHRHPTCPADGTVYTNESVQQLRDVQQSRRRNQGSANADGSSAASGGSQHPGRLTHSQRQVPSIATGGSHLALEVPGIGIARINSGGEGTSERQIPARLRSRGPPAVESAVGTRLPGNNDRIHEVINTTPASFGDPRANVVTHTRHGSHRNRDGPVLTFGDQINEVAMVNRPGSHSDQAIISAPSENAASHTDDDDMHHDNEELHVSKTGYRLSNLTLNFARQILSPPPQLPAQSNFQNSPQDASSGNPSPNFDDMNSRLASVTSDVAPASEVLLFGQTVPRHNSETTAGRHVSGTTSSGCNPTRNRPRIGNQVRVAAEDERELLLDPGRGGGMDINRIRLGDLLGRTGGSASAARTMPSHEASGPLQHLEPIAPTVPLPRNDSTIELDVTAQHQSPAEVPVTQSAQHKPPSGSVKAAQTDASQGEPAGGRKGRLRSRPLYRVAARTPTRSSSGNHGNRERSNSRERTTEDPRSLFIGNDPTTSNGFTAEYIVTADQQRPLQPPAHKRGQGRLHGDRAHGNEASAGTRPWGVTRQLSADQMMLAGSALTQLTLQEGALH